MAIWKKWFVSDCFREAVFWSCLVWEEYIREDIVNIRNRSQKICCCSLLSLNYNFIFLLSMYFYIYIYRNNEEKEKRSEKEEENTERKNRLTLENVSL